MHDSDPYVSNKMLREIVSMLFMYNNFGLFVLHVYKLRNIFHSWTRPINSVTSVRELAEPRLLLGRSQFSEIVALTIDTYLSRSVGGTIQTRPHPFSVVLSPV